MPVLCDKCSLNYCLRHRHPQDHKCTNSTAKGVSKAGLAALSRTGQSQGQTNSQTSRPSMAATAGAYSRSLLSNITGSRAPSNNPPVRSVSALQGNIVSLMHRVTYFVLYKKDNACTIDKLIMKTSCFL